MGFTERLTGNLKGEYLIWMLGNFPEVDRKENAPAQLCESRDPRCPIPSLEQGAWWVELDHSQGLFEASCAATPPQDVKC